MRKQLICVSMHPSIFSLTDRAGHIGLLTGCHFFFFLPQAFGYCLLWFFHPEGFGNSPKNSLQSLLGQTFVPESVTNQQPFGEHVEKTNKGYSTLTGAYQVFFNFMPFFINVHGYFCLVFYLVIKKPIKFWCGGWCLCVQHTHTRLISVTLY